MESRVTPTELAAFPTWAEVERDYLTRLLEACDGKVVLAAKVSGIPRASLYRKVAELGLRTSGQMASEVRAEAQRQSDQAWEELRAHPPARGYQLPEAFQQAIRKVRP